MKTVSISSLRTQSGRRQALGYILLVIIAFGTTVETVHGHGHHGFAPDDPHGIAAISDAGGSHPSHTGHSHISECSMCAFQQQLFNALVHGPLFAIAPMAQIASVDFPTITFPSASITRPSGRAPPLG